MTNKQERYFVVGESELAAALRSARRAEFLTNASGVPNECAESDADQAEAACRAREVPEWATHFATILHVGDDFPYATRDKEIKR